MFYFFADNHYGTHPGKVIYDHLPEELKKQTAFYEDDWNVLQNSDWDRDCRVLILDMIGATCNLPHPDSNAEKRMQNYLSRGGNVLLLHGSSAAFWQWQWWRKTVGLRWVRPGDPDQIAPSSHPVKPFALRICKVRHPLAAKLHPAELPADEIYIDLEQVSPVEVLMDTVIDEGVFPQCFINRTPWGGEFLHFLPGHRPEVTGNQTVISNICTMLEYLAG